VAGVPARGSATAPTAATTDSPNVTANHLCLRVIITSLIDESPPLGKGFELSQKEPDDTSAAIA
jgi:hypothetical protein